MKHWPSELEYEHEYHKKYHKKKSLFEKVKDRVGMISANPPSHMHTHHIVNAGNGQEVGYSSQGWSNAVLDGGAFEVLCDIIEEELFPKIEEKEFLDEDEMNIK